MDPAATVITDSRWRNGAAQEMADGSERLEHVLGILDQGRAFADQQIAALRARIERRAGHRHHLAAAIRWRNAR